MRKGWSDISIYSMWELTLVFLFTKRDSTYIIINFDMYVAVLSYPSKIGEWVCTWFGVTWLRAVAFHLLLALTAIHQNHLQSLPCVYRYSMCTHPPGPLSPHTHPPESAPLAKQSKSSIFSEIINVSPLGALPLICPVQPTSLTHQIYSSVTRDRNLFSLGSYHIP